MILKGKVGLSWPLLSKKEPLMFSWDASTHIIFLLKISIIILFSSNGTQIKNKKTLIILLVTYS